MTYESFFEFQACPFPSAPQVSRYFPSADAEHALQNLRRCLEYAEGPGLLIGAPGTGKSLLCQLLADKLGDRRQVVMLNSARLCTRRALLQNVLFELQLPYRVMDEGELRFSLIDHLKEPEASRDGMLLIVDEAHTLPLRLVEEIRMLTNLVCNGQPRVRLLLAGTPRLEERLAHPQLESLTQRIAARCYLQPLGYEETLAYVRAQIGSVGGSPDSIFVGDALQTVHRLTGGVPRLINQLCNHALIEAAENLHQQVNAETIERSWAELQQLPAPRTPAAAEAAGSVIEFGSLDPPPSGDGPATRPTAAEERADHPDSEPTEAMAGEPSAEQVPDLTERWDQVEAQVAALEACEAAAEQPESPPCQSTQPDASATVLSGDEQPPADASPAGEASIEELSTEEPSTEAAPGATLEGAQPAAWVAEDPFDECFDSEELVIDHYARLAEQTGTRAAIALDRAEPQTEPTRMDEPTKLEPPVASAPLPADESAEAEQPRDRTACGDDSRDGVCPDQPGAADELSLQPAEEDEEDDEADRELINKLLETIALSPDEADESEEYPDICPIGPRQQPAGDSPRAEVIRSVPADDRDLIRLIDPEDLQPETGPNAEASRSDYRRLFSRLRDGR